MAIPLLSRSRRALLSCSMVTMLAAASASPANPAGLTEAELLATAPERIEKHRKSDVVIVVLDSQGQPVPGAKIDLRQTRHAFLFGANIFLFGRAGEAAAEEAYRERFAELLNYATLPFYWPSYEARRGQPDHARTRETAQWCREHQIATKGHPLAWNFADPAWLPDDAEEIRRLQMARIDDCVRRFTGLVDRWDVVNEATHFDREDLAKRRAPKLTAMWKQAGQIELTRECFAHARKANPAAVLLINDYRTDAAYEKVIEQLVDPEGRRMYDVIGIQSHMHGGVWPSEKLWEVCERFARFGVPLHFTETTIVSGTRQWESKAGRPWPSTPEGEALQAQAAVRFYTILFSHPAVEAITWWDFSDRGAWKGAPAGFLRRDMSPKPMYEELKRLIKGAWWTTAALVTGPDGTVGCRGFLGEYRLSVTLPGKPPVVKSFTLKKGQPNRWECRVE